MARDIRILHLKPLDPRDNSNERDLNARAGYRAATELNTRSEPLRYFIFRTSPVTTP
jgi:hypothetical protein